jgi:heme exporter protein D
MVVGMIALAVVVVATIRERRDGKALLLLVLLAGALASRRSPDALDLLYAVSALALAVLWFLSGRRHRPIPDGTSDAHAGRSKPPRSELGS